MPTRRLTGQSIKALQSIDGRRTEYFDESLPGFGVRVSPSGHKSFCLFYRRGKRLRRFTLGRFPALSLAQARALARDALLEVARGGDPAVNKTETRQADTFAELADEYLERHAKPNKKSWRQDQCVIRKELDPVLGRMLAKDVSRADIRELLEKIVKRPAPSKANATHTIVRKLFNWALSQDLVERNPCHGLPRPAKVRQRHHVLSEGDIRKLWASLNEETCRTAALFKLRLLTAQRGGEVIGMRWREIDLDSAWWTIPSERSKNGLPHRVPLSPPALAILKNLHQQSHDSPWAFPSPRGNSHLTDSYKFAKRIRETAGIEFRGHDLRRTAASFMASMGVPRLVVARILNHAEKGVTAVYDRHSYDPEKRRALHAWAMRLDAIVRGETAAYVLSAWGCWQTGHFDITRSLSYS